MKKTLKEKILLFILTILLASVILVALIGIISGAITSTGFLSYYIFTI